MEYFGALIHTTGLEQALQILSQTDPFINILKYAPEARRKTFSSGIYNKVNIIISQKQ